CDHKPETRKLLEINGRVVWFVERSNGPAMPLFVFQRREEHAPTQRKPATRAAEKQKERGYGGRRSINRPSLRDLEGSPKSKAYAVREEMWVMIRVLCRFQSFFA